MYLGCSLILYFFVLADAHVFGFARQPFVVSLLFVVMLFAAGIASANNTNPSRYADPAIEGRWDITITENGKEVPSWLEVNHSGHHTLVGHFVGVGGSARPISRVNFISGK